MHHSAPHGGHVSLWIQAKADDCFQVDAVHPMDGYRVLFRERFTTAGAARAFWQAQFKALFGVDPLE